MPYAIQHFNVRQHMLPRDFEIFRYRDSYLSDVELHHHDFYELYLFLSGDVSYVIESRNYQLLPGDLLLISPSELHQPLISPQRQPYERVVLWINRAHLRQLSSVHTDLTACFEQARSGGGNLLRLDSMGQETVRSAMECLLDETATQRYGSDLAADCQLTRLLIDLHRMQLDVARAQVPRGITDPGITDVINYINEHYGEPLTIDLLAARFFFNKYHLSHAFKRVVGTSIHRYITQKRLLIARQMLADGRTPADVYHICGYADYSNFYRAFKNEYGVSPKTYLSTLKT